MKNLFTQTVSIGGATCLKSNTRMDHTRKSRSCGGRRFLMALVLFGLMLLYPHAGWTQNKMYFTDAFSNTIQRANLDGSSVEDLVTGLNDPFGIALDLAAGKMYWTDAGTAKIQRANLDGSSIEDLVTGLAAPVGIALDVAAGKMYWTDFVTNKIQRANLDGSSVEDLVTGLGDPYGIALDLAAGKIYWTDTGIAKIQRANLDGSGVEDLVTTGLGSPREIALDVAAGKMYWTDSFTAKIQRANLDGTSIEDLVTGLVDPFGIALDVAAGKMYWTDVGTGKIQRANLDGSSVEDLVTGLSFPFGIALDVPVTAPDPNPPGCTVTQIIPGPPKQIRITIQDTQSGVASIVVVTATNTTVSIPAFTGGTTSPVIVTATKTNQAQSSTVVLRVRDAAGNETVCDPVYTTISAQIPQSFGLGANYPNPFNPTTRITFNVAKTETPTLVRITVYDVLGKEVTTLLNESMQPGQYYVDWDGTDIRGNVVTSGMYLYRMTAGDFVATRRMALMK